MLDAGLAERVKRGSAATGRANPWRGDRGLNRIGHIPARPSNFLSKSVVRCAL
jgi:hypothetical protein